MNNLNEKKQTKNSDLGTIVTSVSHARTPSSENLNNLPKVVQTVCGRSEAPSRGCLSHTEDPQAEDKTVSEPRRQ